MDIAVAQPAQIRVSNVGVVGFKALISAAALYALCVSAPGVYRAHPAIREFERQTAQGQLLVERLLSQLREQHRAVLAEAASKKAPESRVAFLEEEVARARAELDGYTIQLRIARSIAARWDTWFHRITGHKVLASMKQIGRQCEMMHAIAARHVENLNHALRQCDP